MERMIEEILRRMDRIEASLQKLNDEVDALSDEVAMIKGKMDTTTMLTKWIIFPLLIILAGLVGVKLALPT